MSDGTGPEPVATELATGMRMYLDLTGPSG
jgi:hypothetical protein